MYICFANIGCGSAKSSLKTSFSLASALTFRYICDDKIEMIGKMRLLAKEIKVIREVAKEIYGNGVQVYLFGSRTDDSKRGGDIDLLVRTSNPVHGVLSRIRMKARLKELLGDQKIDVVDGHEQSIVVDEAIRKGILLT